MPFSLTSPSKCACRCLLKVGDYSPYVEWLHHSLRLRILVCILSLLYLWLQRFEVLGGFPVLSLQLVSVPCRRLVSTEGFRHCPSNSALHVLHSHSLTCQDCLSKPQRGLCGASRFCGRTPAALPNFPLPLCPQHSSRACFLRHLWAQRAFPSDWGELLPSTKWDPVIQPGTMTSSHSIDLPGCICATKNNFSHHVWLRNGKRLYLLS